MAKSLPYFKFYSSEWNDGDITMLNMNDQGLFINICSLYWSKECRVKLAFIQSRFPSYYEGLNTLIENNLIENLDDGYLKIRFLDEQLGSRDGRSSTSKTNGAKGGRPKKPNKPKPNLTKPNIEERREEERRDIIGYLNKISGKNFRTDKGLLARLDEGYTVDDCKRVINTKFAEWNETEQAKYIRPETLFGTKFDMYLNQDPIKTYKDLPYSERNKIYVDKINKKVYDLDGSISIKWEYDSTINQVTMK